MNGFSRRRFVRGIGGVLASGVLVGCSSDDQEDSGDAWQDVDTIRLDGQVQNWVGVAPGVIEDEENPTLVLHEGREYDVTWKNVDGVPHNIEFRDENAAVITGTDSMRNKGETQTLTFEATAEMAEYVCFPHETTMVGDVEIVSE